MTLSGIANLSYRVGRIACVEGSALVLLGSAAKLHSVLFEERAASDRGWPPGRRAFYLAIQIAPFLILSTENGALPLTSRRLCESLVNGLLLSFDGAMLCKARNKERAPYLYLIPRLIEAALRRLYLGGEALPLLGWTALPALLFESAAVSRIAYFITPIPEFFVQSGLIAWSILPLKAFFERRAADQDEILATACLIRCSLFITETVSRKFSIGYLTLISLNFLAFIPEQIAADEFQLGTELTYHAQSFIAARLGFAHLYYRQNC